MGRAGGREAVFVYVEQSAIFTLSTRPDKLKSKAKKSAYTSLDVLVSSLYACFRGSGGHFTARSGLQRAVKYFTASWRSCSGR
jgi:hypothetical protein